MSDSRPRAHHLHVSGAGATLVAHGILVRDRAGAHVGHDLHVAVRVRRKAALRRDLVVVPHADPAPAHSARVIVIREGEMVAGIKPPVVGVAEGVEGADVDHGANLGPSAGASSVSHVTNGRGIQMPEVAKVGTSTRAHARERRETRRFAALVRVRGGQPVGSVSSLSFVGFCVHQGSSSRDPSAMSKHGL
jgi:hypothetical protein